MADQSKTTPHPTTQYCAHGAAANTITSALPSASNFRRQDSAKNSEPWGFALGDPASPLYHSCPSGYSQTVVGIFGDFIGCCRNGVCVNNIEYCAAYLENTSFLSIMVASWTSCPAEIPACVTYAVRATNNEPSIQSYACGETSTVIDVARSVAGSEDGTSQTWVSASATSTREVGSASTAGPGDGGGSSPPSSAVLAKIVAILLGIVLSFFLRKHKRDKEKRRMDVLRYVPADVLPLKTVRNDRHDNHNARHDNATGGDGGYMLNGNIYGNVYYTRGPT